MIGGVFGIVLRSIGLILLQAMVIDHMDLASGWITPYIYVLALLMLPFDTPAWAGLCIGFVTGLIMDLFSATPGLHTSACTVMAYARLWVLRLVAPRDGYEFGRRPTISHMGMAWFFTYAGLLILVHHLWLFYAEVYRFHHPFSTLLRAVLSGLATLALCLLAQGFGPRTTRMRA